MRDCAEYGEVLLLDDTGEIERAYPLPGWPPGWIHETDEAIDPLEVEEQPARLLGGADEGEARPPHQR